jgi:hypothetical protein
MERNSQHTNLSFAIGIPTLNRADLLSQALIKYIYDFPEISIYVLDNGNQELPNFAKLGRPVYIIKSEKNCHYQNHYRRRIYSINLLLRNDLYTH